MMRDFLRSTVRTTLFFYAVLVALTAYLWWKGVFRPNLAGLAYTLTWPFVAGAIGGSILAFVRRPSLRQVAERVDALGGTRDRLLTALDFAEKPRTTELEHLAQVESAAFAKGKDFRGLIPIRPPEELRWLAVPLAALGIMWWDGLKAATDDAKRVQEATAATAGTVKQLETMAEALRKGVADNEEARRLADRLKQSAAQVRSEAEAGRDAQKAALRELALLEQLVKELRRPDAPTSEELKAVAGALEKLESTSEAAKEIRQGNLAEAAKKLEAAAKDEKVAEQAQKEIQQALDHLAQRNEQLSKELEKMRQQAQQGGGARQELLKQLSELLNEMQQQQQQQGTAGQQQQQKEGGQKGGQQQQQGQGKPMTDDELKQLLGALQRMKDQQQGDGGQPQPGEGEGKGEKAEGGITMQTFSNRDANDEPGDPDPSLPSGKPGDEKDKGTTPTPFGKDGAAGEAARQEQLGGKLAEGETLSVLAPAAAGGDAKATRRYKEITDAAAAAAADAVMQENIPLGSRFLIRRYFEAIRPK